ncbi:hypothetical protein SNE26_14665 [Mucilaginibacter sp. cycad4]|uniref:hypothetical protein n=1 Tax=Mucilaginibacter sp. cycad4 TaxID=3342096 RepID=UPI002AAB5AB1|nr:hypothetical protein [Mucilaginibacter gossypii]WPU97267.1 hypothetical protein SNE26_14665 [Mucilaginibacter gossypii]
MRSEMLKLAIDELSVGNWVQNFAFYSLLALLSWAVIMQIKSTSKIEFRKRRTAK